MSMERVIIALLIAAASADVSIGSSEPPSSITSTTFSSKSNELSDANAESTMRAGKETLAKTGVESVIYNNQESVGMLLMRELLFKFPIELFVLSAAMLGFFMFRGSDAAGKGAWWNRASNAAGGDAARRLEKSIHRGFHSGKNKTVMDTWTKVRDSGSWLSRVALELVLRAMVADDRVDAPSIEQYVRRHYPKEKEQVRMITSLVEMCAQRGFVDAMTAIVRAREATGTPFELARLGAYLSMVGTYASAGREDEVSMTLDAIEKSEGAVPHRAFVVAIMGLQKCDSLWPAIRLMGKMEEHTFTVPSQCLVAFFKAAHERKETSVLLEQALLLKTPLPADAIAVAAYSALQTGDLELADRIASLHKDASPNYESCVALITLFAQHRSDRSVSLFSETAVSVIFSASTCRDLLKTCAEHNYSALIDAVMSYAEKHEYLDANCNFAASLYGAAIHATSSAGEPEQSATLREQMASRGLDLADANRPAGPPRRAVEAFRKAARDEMSMSEYTGHLRLAAEYCDPDYASEVVEHMRRKHGEKACCAGSPSALSSALSVFVRGHQVEAGHVLLRSFNQYSTVQDWNIVLNGYCGVSDLTAARATINEMKQSADSKPNAASYNCLLCVFLGDCMYEEARELISEMRRDSDVGVATIALLARFLQTTSQQPQSNYDVTDDKQSRPEQAMHARARDRAELAKEAILSISKANPDLLSEEVGRSVISGCLAFNELTPLRAILPQLPRSSVHTYAGVIKAYSALGEVDEVLRVWDEMATQKKIVPSQVCLGHVLNVLATHGRPGAARELLKDWKNLVTPNCVMYTTVLKGLARAKDVDSALEVWQEMKRDGVEPNVKAYNTLLDACARSGRMDSDGQVVLKEMHDRNIPVASVTVSTAVKGYCQMGLLAEAAASLGEAFASKKEGSGETPDASAFNALLDGCVRSGELGRFDETYASMHKAGVKPTSFTLTALVKRYGNANRLGDAYDAVETVTRKYGRHLRNKHVATCLLSASFRNREPQRAFAFFDELQKDGVHLDSVTYATVISGTKNMGMAGLKLAVRYATESLIHPGPGLPDYAVSELIDRMAGAGVLDTVGRQLVTDIENAGSKVPRAVSHAISRQVALAAGVGKKQMSMGSPMSKPGADCGTPSTTYSSSASPSWRRMDRMDSMESNWSNHSMNRSGSGLGKCPPAPGLVPAGPSAEMVNRHSGFNSVLQCSPSASPMFSRSTPNAQSAPWGLRK